MSTQPITYESIMEMIRETNRSMKEHEARFDREMQKRDAEYQQRTAEHAYWKAERDKWETIANKKIADLGDRIGQIVENMVGGNIVDKFRALGYDITQYSRHTEFGTPETGEGELDMFLENGNVAILMEVKTNLTVQDVKEHIERMEKYRRHADRRGDPRRFVAAVAGAVVSKEAQAFAHKQGMYVIVQSGEAVEIVPVPKNFHVKQW